MKNPHLRLEQKAKDSSDDVLLTSAFLEAQEAAEKLEFRNRHLGEAFGLLSVFLGVLLEGESVEFADIFLDQVRLAECFEEHMMKRSERIAVFLRDEVI